MLTKQTILSAAREAWNMFGYTTNAYWRDKDEREHWGADNPDKSEVCKCCAIGGAALILNVPRADIIEFLVSVDPNFPRKFIETSDGAGSPEKALAALEALPW